MKNEKDEVHTEVYWQTYRQMLEAGHDIRLARLEAAGAERNAREAVRQTEQTAKHAEQKAPKKRAKGNSRTPQKEKDAAKKPEKGIASLARVKLFAEVRQEEIKQDDMLERLRQVRQQPLSQRVIPEELTPAQKKYLLTMYHLDSNVLTQRKIATTLNITPASVHRIIHGLIELEMVERCDQFSITLSEKGLFTAINLHDCYGAIVEDLLRYLPPEEFRQQEQDALEAVLKMPRNLVKELLRGLETRKNFSEEKESLPAAE